MLLIGTACRLGFSFVFVIYVASLLGVDGFGTYSLGVHYFELFVSLTAAAIGIFVTREAGRRPHRLSPLLSQAIVLVILLSFVSAGAMIGLGRLLGYSIDTQRVLLIGSLAVLPASIAVVFEAAFVSLGQAHLVTSGTALESIMRIAVSYLALRSGGSLAALFWILVGTRSVLVLFYGWKLGRRIPLRWDFRRRRFWMFASRWRVFAAENWLATVYTSLDVVILSAFHGETAVGVYTAALKVVRLGSMAVKCYTTAVFPVLARWYVQSRDAFDQLNRDTLRILLAAMLPAATIIAVFAEQIVGLLFADKYADAVPVLRVLAWVMLLESLNPFLSHMLFAKGQQHYSMRVAAISLAVNFTATIFLASRWGSVGAACGMLVGALVACMTYCYYGLDRQDAVALMVVAAKVAVAAAILAAVVLLAPASWAVPALAAAALIYLRLVTLLRVVTA
ncbi:MAG: flippase, partial [Planctomycetaceae bacterium]|nr:flippase [Planctomycetaceae bacterium]